MHARALACACVACLAYAHHAHTDDKYPCEDSLLPAYSLPPPTPAPVSTSVPDRFGDLLQIWSFFNTCMGAALCCVRFLFFFVVLFMHVWYVYCVYCFHSFLSKSPSFVILFFFFRLF